MNPQNSRYLLLGVIVAAFAAVLIFSPQVAQALLHDLIDNVLVVVLLGYFAVVVLKR